jgi:hypothetical protein
MPDFCLCGCGAQGGCFTEIEDENPDLYREPDFVEFELPYDDGDIYLAQWDDDPNVYEGTYSEE